MVSGVRDSFRHLFGQIQSIVRRFGLPRKWLFVFGVLIVLPGIVILYAYSQRTAAILEEEVSTSMLQTVKQVSANLSYRLGHIRDISNAAAMNPELYRFLQEDSVPEMARQLELLKDLRYLGETVEANADIYRMRLFVNDFTMLPKEHVNFFELDSLKAWPYYERVMEGKGALIWTDIYKQYYYGIGEVDIFSSAKLLHDARNFNQVSAVLVVDVPESLIMDTLSSPDLPNPGNLFIVGDRGNIVAHSDKSRIGTMVEEDIWSAIRQHPEGKVKFQLHNEDDYAMYATIPSTGWKVVAQVPAADMSENIKVKKTDGLVTLAFVFVLFLVLVYVLLSLITRNMNQRLVQVIRMIRKDGIERLDETHTIQDGNFMMLERSVDAMTREMHALMEQTYKAQMLEREAQLRALQAQINPHFLYNTLDMVNWMAIGHGKQDISQVISALAKYFRLSLNGGRDVMSVADELNLAQVYLDLQSNRFQHSFEYRIQPEPNVLDLNLPKLTLQPIVENALLHGIRNLEEDRFGTIRIRAYREDNLLVLEVDDNGIGMEEEQARRLLAEPPLRNRKEGSYGLYNVNERIKLFGGETSGIAISSRPGEGTIVNVRIGLERTTRSNSE
ncbi:sensor histidine kinase [Paenibacillus cymbidii]|uniref:sensor histidine kinase n=1 Tax=Paenibacillus cymbidii TaxID=1639034 RepID=UPI0022A8944C